MRVTLHTAYLILALALSPTLFAFLQVLGVKPNLFLIYLVIAGFYVSKTESIWLGLVFGFAFDLIVGMKIGLNAVLYMFACFFVTLLCENMIRRSNAVVVFVCTVLWTVVFEGIAAVLSSANGMLYILKVLGIEAVYNGVLALVVYAVLSRLFVRLYDEKG